MLDVFGSVKTLLKLEPVCIDNNIFRLHYKATVIILLAFSLIVTSKQYIGDPIDCVVDKDSIPQKIMDTYCWIHSTFTVPDKLHGRIGKDVARPGIGHFVAGEDEVKYHQYYQWVCFVLFFQAMMFYAPRYLWKTWEGGRLKMLALELNCPMLNEETIKTRKNLIVQYFAKNLHLHNFYAARFFICEVLNFVNVVAQIYLMDYFLDGDFSSYGLDVLNFGDKEFDDIEGNPMNRVFPKVTKCTFHRYGPSGTIQITDGLCVLPVNIVNEKIYVFLWFWFICLTFLTGFALIFRAVVILEPTTRTYLLRARARFASKDQIKTITRRCQIGDWFILHQLSKNIDPLIYREIVNDLYVMLSESKGTDC